MIELCSFCCHYDDVCQLFSDFNHPSGFRVFSCTKFQCINPFRCDLIFSDDIDNEIIGFSFSNQVSKTRNKNLIYRKYVFKEKKKSSFVS